MRHIRFLVSQCHGSDETLHFYRLPGKAFAHESCFGDHTLPSFTLALSGFHDPEHLLLCNTTDFGQRDRVFRSFVFPLLLNGRRESLGIFLCLSIEEIGGESFFG